MKSAATFLAFLLLFASYLLHSKELDATTLISKALERDVEMRLEQQKYQYDLTILKQKLDDKDQIIRSKTIKTTLQPNKEIRFETEVDSSEEAKRQAREKEKNVRNAQKIMAVMDFKKLAPRFQLRLEGSDTLRGMACSVISFTPKPDQPYDSREEKVVNHLSGKVWIDQKTFSIVQYEAHLTKPVSVAWFLASMESLECRYESMTLANGDIVPSNFNISFRLDTAVSDLREKQLHTMTNYQILKP